MGVRWMLLGLVLINGCSGGDGGDGPCVFLDGTYQVDTTRRSGSCPVIPEVIQVIHPWDPFPAGCDKTFYQLSDDHCRADQTVTCVDLVTGISSTATGVTHYSHDGASATVVLGIAISGPGTEFCASTYDVIYTRL